MRRLVTLVLHLANQLHTEEAEARASKAREYSDHRPTEPTPQHHKEKQ